MDKAVDLLSKAVELDQNYAIARGMLAYGYAHRAIWHEENQDLIRRANAELELAEKLDPQLAEIHVARSFILVSHYKGYQFEEALRELRQAQRLDQNEGHFELAFIYAHLGLDEWQRELERALEIEPTSEVIKDHIIRFYFINHKQEEALASVKRYSLGERDPAYPQYLALYSLEKKMWKEAETIVEAIAKKNQDWINFRGLWLALQGMFREAEATVNEDWERTKIPPVYHPVYHHFTHNAARIYALEGKSEEAVKWLRVTAEEGFPNYLLLLRDPYLDSIRNHPAFVQFMAEMKTRWESYRRTIR
jgi:tetratricopeptide (TPR) repeat protein